MTNREKTFTEISKGVRYTDAQIDGKQCDQIGRFLQVLDNKLPHKSSPNILVTILGAISKDVLFV